MLFTLLSLACSRAPIVDQWSHNSVVQIKDSFTSVFLIEHEELILIDSGYSSKSKPIASYLETTGRSLTDIKHIFFTHGHGDHCAGLENFPNATLYAHEDELTLLKEETGREDIEKLTEEAYCLGDLRIKPYEVEGHSAGNLIYIIDHVLIMGDSAQSYKDGSISPPAKNFSDDPELAAQSLEKLGERVQEEEIDWIAFSHSGAIEGTEALNSYRAE